jgi:hypothetical protein
LSLGTRLLFAPLAASALSGLIPALSDRYGPIRNVLLNANAWDAPPFGGSS